MTDTPSDLPQGDEPQPERVFVTTALPVPLRVAALDDERVGEGACLGSFIGDRLIARCVVPAEAIEQLIELDLFAEPVPLGLLAFEESPGLQCRLFALVPAGALGDEDEEESADEPWKASVPSYVPGAPEEEAEQQTAAILLGNIVRFDRDRKHPENLVLEAVDVLQKIVTGGPLQDASSRAIDDLLGSI